MFEIFDTQIDVETIMAKIRENIRRGGTGGVLFDEESMDEIAPIGAFPPSPFNLAHHMNLLRLLQDPNPQGPIASRGSFVLAWAKRFIRRILAPYHRAIFARQAEFNANVIRMLAGLMNGLVALSVRVTNTTEQAQKLEHQQQAQLREIASQVANVENQLGRLKTRVNSQESEVRLLFEEMRKHLGVPSDSIHLRSIAQEMMQLRDQLYVSFEDQFRGTRDEIRERSRIYLPIIREAGAGSEDRPILDIGCGRGEWLELLAKEGLGAEGVDTNRVMVARCQELGLHVTEGDSLVYLHSLPDSSVGAVTGIHIVEHLPYEALLTLLSETMRVLKPSGVAIFETPNPENLIVGACHFYLDPTHKHPLPPETLKFLATSKGFARVQIIYRPTPIESEMAKPISDDTSPTGARVEFLSNLVGKWLMGPLDYAIIGWKP